MTLSRITNKRDKQTYPDGTTFDWKLYTDGSWNAATKAGGWAVTLQHRPLKSGYETETTSIRMEVTAMIKALEIARPRTIILTDSKFVIESINIYCPAWERSGWTSETMANKELMQKLWRAWQARADGVGIKWIKGHNGMKGNETADREAVRQRKSIEPNRSTRRKYRKKPAKPNKPKGLVGTAKARAELRRANDAHFGKGNY